jgi:hypothetical protein
MRNGEIRARWSAALVAGVSLVGIICQFAHDRETGLTAAASLWRMAHFFTNIGNVAVILVFGAVALRGRARVSARSIGLATLAILLVGVVFSLLLRGLHHPSGLQYWASRLLHDIAPPLALLWWLVFAPRGQLSRGTPWRWLVLPLLYTLFVQIVGALEGFYPYFFMNPARIGWGGVIGALAGIAVGFLAVGCALVAIDQWLARRGQAR